MSFKTSEYMKLEKENKDLWEMNKILADSRLKILGENQELKKRHEELIFMLAEKDKQIAKIPTREIIIEVLDEYFGKDNDSIVNTEFKRYDLIATEILGDDDEK